MGIKWKESLALGIDEIDDQHRALFDRMNHFLDACDEGRGSEELVPLLRFLDDYARFHFEAEERLQESHGYRHAESHRTDHRRFIAMLRELKGTFLREGPTPKVAEEVNQALVEWLLKHVAGRDREFGRFMQQRFPEEVHHERH